MKHFLLFLGLFSLYNIITACNFLPISVNSQPSPQEELTTLTENIMLKVSLLSREEKLSPIGINPQPNRNIGFATVFLNLENHKEANQAINIQNIEIRNSSNHQLQSFDFEPRQIELKPLENSIIDIHLTNKTGYVGEDQVQAIVTYKIGDQVNTIESDSVAIDRH